MAWEAVMVSLASPGGPECVQLEVGRRSDDDAGHGREGEEGVDGGEGGS